MEDQIRALLWEKLAVEHDTEEGLVSHVKTLVFWGSYQEVVQNVWVLLNMLPVFIFGVLVYSIAKEHLKILGVA
jgi:hypothetical protein